MLRDEIMQFAAGTDGGEGAATRSSAEDEDDDLAGLFVIITDERCFFFQEPFIRKVGTNIHLSTSLCLLTLEFVV